MIYATISLKNKQDLMNYISREISKQILQDLLQNKSSILVNCATFIKDNFENSPYVKSIMEGDLQAELGLTSSMAHSTLNEIIKTVLSELQLEISYKIFISSSSFQVRLYALPIGYQKLLSISGASYESEPSGDTIPWLDWLINGKAFILGYVILKGDTFGLRSRSGKAIMAKSKKKNWVLNLPPDLNTRPDDNFLTKIFENVQHILLIEVEDIIHA